MELYMKKISFILFLLILTLPICTEDTGLLEKKLSSASDEAKGRILVKLIEEYIGIDISKAEKYANQAETLITSVNDPILKIDIL